MADVSGTLAQQFMDSAGAPIDVDGQPCYLNVDLGPLPRSHLFVTLSGRTDREQALCFAATGGQVEVDGQRAKAMVLWRETSPPTVNVAILPSRKSGLTLRFWNAWRGSHGAMHSGIGNFGIRVIREPGKLMMTCSDGWGDVSFGDLVAEIRHESIPEA